MAKTSSRTQRKTVRSLPIHQLVYSDSDSEIKQTRACLSTPLLMAVRFRVRQFSHLETEINHTYLLVLF